MDNRNKILALAVTHALARAENGGKIPETSTAGKTGEMKSIFQFTPDTWKKYSGEILGNPNAQMDNDTETSVVVGKVKKWIDQGYTPPQIGSMWNAGEREPNAYTGKFSDGSRSVGVNKQYNVPFDVPSYAKKVDEYTKDAYIKLERSAQDSANQPSNQVSNNESHTQSLTYNQ